MKIIRRQEIEVEQKEIRPGDQIAIDLKDGRGYLATAIDYKDGKMLFVFDECVDRRPMNKKMTTEGGYEKSDMRQWLNERFYNLLPEELQEKLIPDENRDNLWLLSLEEVAGCDSNFDDCDGILKYFESEKNRVAEFEGETAGWWLRSVVSSANFAGVTSGGIANYSGASNALGVRPAFAIEA